MDSRGKQRRQRYKERIKKVKNFDKRRGERCFRKERSDSERSVQTKRNCEKLRNTHNSHLPLPFDADHAPAPRSALCVERRANLCQTQAFSCSPASSICTKGSTGAENVWRNVPSIVVAVDEGESGAERRRPSLVSLPVLLCPNARPHGLPRKHLPQPGGGGRARPPGQEEEARGFGVRRLVRHGEFSFFPYFVFSFPPRSATKTRYESHTQLIYQTHKQKTQREGAAATGTRRAATATTRATPPTRGCAPPPPGGGSP